MDIQRAVTDGVTRALAVVALQASPSSTCSTPPERSRMAPYRGVLYVLLISGCIATGAALVRGGDRRAWVGIASLFVESAIVGLAASRVLAFAPAVRRELVAARG